jgi:hypothetical protein
VIAAPFAVLLFLGGTTRRRLSPPTFTAGFVGAYALLALLTSHGLGFVQALGSTTTMVQWLSVPTGVGMAAGYLLRVLGAPDAFGTAVMIARAAGFAVLAATLLALWWWALRAARRHPERATQPVLTAAGCGLLAAAVLGPVFYAWYAIAGVAVLAATPLTGRLRTVVHGAAVGLVFLTLPDSLGLATKTKVPGAFLDVALVVAGAIWWLRRRTGRGRAQSFPDHGGGTVPDFAQDTSSAVCSATPGAFGSTPSS